MIGTPKSRGRRNSKKLLQRRGPNLIAHDKYGELTTITDIGYDVYAPQLDDRLNPAESHHATRKELVANMDRIEGLRYSPRPTGDIVAVRDRHP